MTELRALGRQQQDAAAQRVLALLGARGHVPQGAEFDADGFHRLRSRVREHFDVPETAITPLMARVLYGVADALKPRLAVVLGSYAGNALVWLAGPIEGTRGWAVGVDTDPAATALAAANFARLGADHVRCAEADAFEPSAYLGAAVDLLLIDIDEPVRRKSRYLDALFALLPHLADPALVLAHDVCYPAFAGDLGAYLAHVRADERFAGTVTLAIDPYGIEVSRWAPAAAGS